MLMKDLCSGRPIMYISCAQCHSTSHMKEGVDTPPRRLAHAEDATIMMREETDYALAYKQLMFIIISQIKDQSTTKGSTCSNSHKQYINASI